MAVQTPKKMETIQIDTIQEGYVLCLNSSIIRKSGAINTTLHAYRDLYLVGVQGRGIDLESTKSTVEYVEF